MEVNEHESYFIHYDDSQVKSEHIILYNETVFKYNDWWRNIGRTFLCDDTRKYMSAILILDLFSDARVDKLLIYSPPMLYRRYLVVLLVLLGGRAITLVREVKFTSPRFASVNKLRSVFSSMVSTNDSNSGSLPKKRQTTIRTRQVWWIPICANE